LKKYYTLREANELLPALRQSLEEIQRIKGQFNDKYEQLHKLKVEGAENAAGGLASAREDERFMLECELEFLQIEAKAHIQSFEMNGVELKDIDFGLIDFPALVDGEEVLLCWKQGEERITHYHGLHDGFAGRKKIADES